MAPRAPDRLRCQHAKPGGKLGGEHYAERHRLAMEQPIGKSRRRFQSVSERMAEIEERTIAGLALVTRDDCGLHPAARRDRMFARRAASEHLPGVGFEPRE